MTLESVYYLPLNGTLCVYSPFTKGHAGECLSCSDLSI